jgi:hypothetical protein
MATRITKPARPTPVCVTRCDHCGDEVFGFAPATGACLRCARPESQRFPRWINDPHPHTTARAHRESR